MNVVVLSNAPEALAAEISLRSVGNPHPKKEPDQSSAQLWENQWQYFLKTMESPEPRRDVPDLPEKSPPWDDAKAFLDSFEQVGRVFGWPRDEWVARLLPVLSRDTVQAFGRLQAVDGEDYEKLKMTILQSDAMSREMSRQHFRHFCYREEEGPRETYSRLEEFCYRWLKPTIRSKEQILEQLILEQFVAILPPEIQNWVKKNRPENNAQVVLLAEDFILKQRLSRTPQQQGPKQSCRVLDMRATEPIGVLWEPEVETHELSESPTEGFPSDAEGTPSGAGQGLRLYREIRKKEIAHLSNHRNVSADEERTQSPENPEEAEPPQRESGDGPPHSDGRETPQTLHLSEQEESHVVEGGHEFTPSQRQRAAEDTAVFLRVLRRHRSRHATKRRFSCLECGKDFAWKQNLNRHQKIHTGETVHKCPDCEKCFAWKTSLYVHRRRSHAGVRAAVPPDETLYICTECGDSFNGVSDLDVHQRSHAGEAHPGEQPLVDSGGNVTWPPFFERDRKIHPEKKPPLLPGKRTHPGEKKYKCTLCGTGFSKLWQLRKHQLIHTGDHPYKCSDCGESFMWCSSLDRHRKDHAKERLSPPPRNTEEKNHSCAECGKSFQTASQQRRHRCVQTGERLYQCDNCEESFVSSASLDQHQMLHMGNREKAPLSKRRSYLCPDCGKKFLSSSHLKRHRRLHTGEKPNKCSDCGESFMWSSTLEKHRKDHVKERCPQKVPSVKEEPLVGSECGKSLQSASELRNPQRIHTRQRPYKCDRCGNNFKLSTSLHQHKKWCRKGKNSPIVRKCLKCPVCEKSFQKPSHLISHRTIHTGERSFRCGDCGDSFVHDSSLRRHKRLHHKGEITPLLPINGDLHIDSVCGMNFKAASHLRSHRGVHIKGTSGRYKCHDCGKSFNHSSSLSRHRRVQHKGKTVPPNGDLHICSVCGMSFKAVSQLKSHQAVHTKGKESQNKCHDCGKSFVYSSSLSRHRKQIHGRKKAPIVWQETSPLQKRIHVCSVCGKGFDRPSRLVRHRAVHTKEKTQTLRALEKISTPNS